MEKTEGQQAGGPQHLPEAQAPGEKYIGKVKSKFGELSKITRTLTHIVSLDSFQVLFQLETCESMLVISQFICYPQSQSSSPSLL